MPSLLAAGQYSGCTYLNKLPVQEFNSFLDIQIVSRPKESLWDIFIRQLDEVRFEALLQTPTSFVFKRTARAIWMSASIVPLVSLLAIMIRHSIRLLKRSVIDADEFSELDAKYWSTDVWYFSLRVIHVSQTDQKVDDN